jgi:hypothetical protein
MPKFNIELVDPIVTVPTGRSGHIVQVDLRKVPDNVLAELLKQGVIKPLTDISKDPDETEVQWHERRRKRVENWYNGDFTVRGGGTSDPVAVQMKEELVNAYMAASGKSRKEITAFVKGTAVQFLTEQSNARFPPSVLGGQTEENEAARQAWLEAKVADFRARAEATLAERRKAAKTADVDLATLDI